MSVQELYVVVTSIQDRMDRLPVDSSRFKAMLIVNRRLIERLRGSEWALFHQRQNVGKYLYNGNL